MADEKIIFNILCICIAVSYCGFYLFLRGLKYIFDCYVKDNLKIPSKIGENEI